MKLQHTNCLQILCLFQSRIWAKPSLPQAIKNLKERNPDLKRIIATPVFLAPGIHTNIDIPIILGLEPKEIDPRQPDGNYPEGHYLYGLEEVPIL